LLSGGSAKVLYYDRSESCSSQARKGKGKGEDRDRKTLWPRPGIGKGIESAALQHLCRKPDLPHRSLPWKRDRSEPACLQIRQLCSRADLEQELHRSCADIRNRTIGRGRPRWILR